ncbi:tctex1 domain-containing protein 2 isoform X3 [Phasianus colchicus]|uniref:tctex1 domain-containing protein 2 isoform X3 n=1 Tax=Phasianus colchicus TaxID=9054 RepID=UPI00129D69C2|nr:tctex1 domain-containing protein 2 isoform X3 [Phasianus colchicus]
MTSQAASRGAPRRGGSSGGCRGNCWRGGVMGELGSESGDGSAYSLRPGLQRRFKAAAVKECIRAVLKEKLADVQYVPEEIPQLTKSLSEIIKDRLKEEGFERYKMVVQVVIGEQRGEGVKTASFVW